VFPGVDITLPTNWEGYRSPEGEMAEEAEGIEKFHRLSAACMDEFMELKDFSDTAGSGLCHEGAGAIPSGTFFAWKDKTLKDLMDECFTVRT